MTDKQFDLIVLGTGPAGSTVARKAAEQGHRVAIVDSRQFGGTCALRGCNPKKVYANAGALVDQVRRSNGQLVSDDSIQIDWSQLLAFKREFTEPVVEKSEDSFKEDGIETFHGAGRFVGQTEISVDNQNLSADRVLVATGAKPLPLQIPGHEWITLSDDFFELSEIPARVLFIGGGYVSMEFAHVTACCAAEVTVVEQSLRILSGFDPDLCQLLQQYSGERGIEFRFGDKVTAIDIQRDGSLRVELGSGDAVVCDLVVHGAGRIPNIDQLDLELAGIEHDEDGIAVDSYMRCKSNPYVFAAGDCAASGMPPLTPTANEEARIIAENLFADQPQAKPDYGAIPKVAFTTPAIASVGLSEEETKSQNRDVDVRFEETSSWGSVRKTGKTVAGYKIMIDKQTDEVVGAHLLGPSAEETINLFAMAMKFNLTATNIKSTLFAFPTFISDTRRML